MAFITKYKESWTFYLDWSFAALILIINDCEKICWLMITLKYNHLQNSVRTHKLLNYLSEAFTASASWGIWDASYFYSAFINLLNLDDKQW